MLTKLHIKNFKGLKDTEEIPLSSSVVFVGPNNSGKTTALQAIYLWYVGLTKWIEKRANNSKAKERTGIVINRKDLFAVPIKNSKNLWYNLNVRESERDEKGKAISTKNVVIEIILEGVTGNENWKVGLEFDFQSDETIYCRPLKSLNENENAILQDAAKFLKDINIAYLPPMSGLSSEEPKLLPETIAVRIGEGRTAEVLGNLCYGVLHSGLELKPNELSPTEKWKAIVQNIEDFFGIKLKEPTINSRGEIELKYINRDKIELDLSSLGRGAQQVLLLIVYMMSNSNATLLLDEPDAHLEILRQRRIYSLLNEIALKTGSQIIAASHSEVILEEAANKDTVIGFIGKKPFQINDNKSAQLLKSLSSIGFDDYYQAELKKWVLYLEGSTDLAMLKAFAERLNHKVLPYLKIPFFHEIGINVPNVARDHFFGLKEAIPTLKAVAIFDRINKPLNKGDLMETEWKKRELENYFFVPELLIKYAKGNNVDDLFSDHERNLREEAMQESIKMIIPPIALSNFNDEYWFDSKASEQMERIFDLYFKKLKIPILLRKGNYFQLIEYFDKERIDTEIIEKLDLIYQVAESAETN